MLLDATWLSKHAGIIDEKRKDPLDVRASSLLILFIGHLELSKTTIPRQAPERTDD